MVAIAQTIADELLPLIFRRRRPQPTWKTPPFVGDTPIGNDLPEQGGFGGNLLAQDPQPAPPLIVDQNATPSNYALPEESRPRRATQPVTVPPAPIETPVAAPAPVLDTSESRMARRVETDKRGRPTPNIALQGDEQTLDYQNRLARMPEDTEGGGWWPRIRAAIAGFAAGGPVGAAAAFGTRALREHFDPTLGSREYKRDKMSQNAPAVAQIRQARKDQLDEESKMASTGLADARTDALKNPRTNGRIVERKDGVYMIDAKTGAASKIAGIPPEAGTPGSTHYVARKDGVYGINAEHPEGFKVKGIPGEPGKDEEDVGFGNAQVQRAIYDAEQEQRKIDSALNGTPYTDKDGNTHQGAPIPQTIESTSIFGDKRTIPNPEYTYNMTRRRQLDDDIRNWRLKLKSPRKKAASTDNDPLGILDDEP